MAAREKLFTVTIKDCRVDTFRSGGPGGQNQNKVESGVRIVHEPSGAKGESREYRDQLKNKRVAFKRMGETRTFQVWAKIKAAQIMTGKSIEELVDGAMTGRNLKVECRDNIDGRWKIMPLEESEARRFNVDD
jgi:protein subunit release factor B